MAPAPPVRGVWIAPPAECGSCVRKAKGLRHTRSGTCLTPSGVFSVIVQGFLAPCLVILFQSLHPLAQLGSGYTLFHTRGRLLGLKQQMTENGQLVRVGTVGVLG